MVTENRSPANRSSFSSESGWEILRIACAEARIDCTGAKLIRLGENALFHVPNAAVVVRIARSGYGSDARKEVNVSHWLTEREFPAAELYDVDQPITVDSYPVTFWKFIDGRPGSKQDIAALGGVLRRLHETKPPSDFELPHANILGRVRPRIEVAPIPKADRNFLLERLDELESKLPDLRFRLKPGPIHGDAHIKNLMIQDGQAVVIDFERFAWWQPEWDLAMTATEHLTAGWWSADEYHRFVDAYGYDVTSWEDGFDVLRSISELNMTTWLMQNADESAEIAAEYQVRMRTLRGEPSPGWRAF
ncbi:aminoglycoside phosphotransferase family protein [Actinocrispum wychmicini]|uniref:Phosphotransferase family enzyme n=1 Tax=Actinocrispum wychmicini TaxID=1213861 RepID=A0A4R2IUM0_9PSEU|nr:aminoglycoside phosphotransferase family protein [Actinocrispum wychmicini]TCO47989.1 phosphotransferase family enzyme [Actinocrispum wychmicini]